MKVLLTGANGYIGTRLVPALLEQGHEIVCLVRDKRRFQKNNDFGHKVTIITGDLLKEVSIQAIPPDIDATYYLSHSITGNKEFSQLEALSAHHFVQALNYTNCRQLIFLSGIEPESNGTQYLTSRGYVESILREAKAALTVLRSAIIVGRSSPLFGIISELTERHPVITVPGCVKNKCRPIAVSDVLAYLEGVLLNEKAFNQTFEIGGPDILSYKDMMLTYAKVHQLKRKIVTLPFLPAKASAYLLCFSSSATYLQAQKLVDSMQHEAIVKDKRINAVVPHQCMSYEKALEPDADVEKVKHDQVELERHV